MAFGGLCRNAGPSAVHLDGPVVTSLDIDASSHGQLKAYRYAVARAALRRLLS
jgi:hypothetical protein